MIANLQVGCWYKHDGFPRHVFQVWRGYNGGSRLYGIRYRVMPDGSYEPTYGPNANMQLFDFDAERMHLIVHTYLDDLTEQEDSR